MGRSFFYVSKKEYGNSLVTFSWLWAKPLRSVEVELFCDHFSLFFKYMWAGMAEITLILAKSIEFQLQ